MPNSNDEFIMGAEPNDPFDPAQLEILEKQIAEKGIEKDATVLGLLNRRRLAYVNVFTEGKRENADIDIVLNDLMYFCKVWVPTYDVKDGIHAEELSKRKDGRREVFQRIKDFTRLDSDALLMKYTDATTK